MAEEKINFGHIIVDESARAQTLVESIRVMASENDHPEVHVVNLAEILYGIERELFRKLNADFDPDVNVKEAFEKLEKGEADYQ